MRMVYLSDLSPPHNSFSLHLESNLIVIITSTETSTVFSPLNFLLRKMFYVLFIAQMLFLTVIKKSKNTTVMYEITNFMYIFGMTELIKKFLYCADSALIRMLQSSKI